ncbi:hypothetical protein ABEB36_015203 [Hypothenemus hampei]|uniref:Uncharacterized protein n=1 Tax=Hypothenemus hampei TaxID=57062 RepID=A0ABD1E103_HYPHA
MDFGNYESEIAEFLLIPSPSVPNEVIVNTSSPHVVWSKNETKVLLDGYKKYRPKVGTADIRNLKKLILQINITAQHTENRWRVLERAYKKHVDNQRKTGQGTKFFEYVNEMDEIFKGKKNITPVVLLSSESVEEMPNDEAEKTERDIENPKPRGSTLQSKKNDFMKHKRTPVVNRNTARLLLEQEKVEISKRKANAIEERNILLKERNEILKKQKSVN